MTNEKSILKVNKDHQGIRLDRFLSLCRPELSQRAAKRLVQRGNVLVDGHPRAGIYKLKSGQMVEISTQPSNEDPEDFPWVVRASEDYVAFFKPAGLNTARLAGVGGPSLEQYLPELVPGRNVWLVNRLDQPTTGLVLGVFSLEAAAGFKILENQGQVCKLYLALVEGKMDDPVRLAWRLNTAKRSRVKVMPRESDDPLRWTWARPLALVGDRTLLRVRIAKGARHQIRAHLAGLGHPIAGDALYGYGSSTGDKLYLHHYLVRLPGFSAMAAPEWPDLGMQWENIMDSQQGGDPCAAWQ